MHRHAGIVAGIVVGLVVMAAVWGVPTLASAQGLPVFGRLDAGGMPECLIELRASGESPGWLVNAQRPYVFWAASKTVGVSHLRANWRSYGPWTLAGRRHYAFVWSGGAGTLANNDRAIATGSNLSPDLASAGLKNHTAGSGWFIVNPLPPGCGVGGAGAEESTVTPPVGHEPCGGRLHGAWNLTTNSNGAKLEVSGTAGGYSARVFYAIVGKWEPLEQITLDAGSCKVSFVRIVLPGRFASRRIVFTCVGTLKGNRIDGQCKSSDGGTYPWDATR